MVLFDEWRELLGVEAHGNLAAALSYASTRGMFTRQDPSKQTGATYSPDHTGLLMKDALDKI